MQETNKTPWQLTRMLMVLCWLVWILTFFITVTVFQAVLQIHVVAQVVQNVDKGFIWFNTDLVEATPLTSIKSNRFDEMLVRYYLEMRYSIVPDSEEMKRRWGPKSDLAYLSAPKVYKEFSPDENTYEKMDRAFPKVVDILNLELHLERRGHYYSVDFDTYTYDGLSGWVKESKSAVVHFAHVRSRSALGSPISNPYGFVVTNVSESDRKATQ